MFGLGLGLAASALAMPRNGLTKIFGFNAIQKHIRRSRIKVRRGHSIATANRWTGQPHEHKREIARRLRQQGRLHMNYMLNGGFSRRGNEGAGL